MLKRTLTLTFSTFVCFSILLFFPQTNWAETITWPWKATNSQGIDGHTLENITINVEANTEVCVLPPSYFEGSLRYYVGGYDNGTIWWTGTTVSEDYPKCKTFPSGGSVTISSDTSFTANPPYGPGTITYTPGTAAPPRLWQTETVDATYTMGAYNSIAVDSSGHPHISYYDWTYYDLKYAYFNGSNWVITTVDGAGVDCGNYTSIALDSNDRPHIAYRSNEGVKYAYLDDQGVWQPEIVVPIGGSPYLIYAETSLALDSNDTPHICFMAGDSPYYANPVMKYISKDTMGNWTSVEDVDVDPSISNMGSFSIAVDGANTPHIGYYKNSRPWYAMRTGLNSWSTEQIVDNYSYRVSIATDSSGIPHISFQRDLSSSSTEGLYHAHKSNGIDWTVEPIDLSTVESLYDASITIDSNDNPHIAYNGYASILKYAYHDGSQWNVEIVDTDSVISQHVDIAVGPDDEPHISYYRVTGQDLKYAVLSSSVINDPDSDDDGINDSIDGRVVPNTTNFIDDSGVYSNQFTDQHLGGTTYGEIIDRNGLDVFIDDLSLSGVVINVKGDWMTYALINVCGIPYAFYGGDSGTMTCGSSTALILSGQPEAHLLGNVLLLLPNGSMSTIDELSEGGYSILNHDQSLGPITIVDNGVELDVQAGESENVSVQTGDLNIDIDIKPGSYPNCFNINDHGVIPVAILGGQDFDVTTVDTTTLFFGGLQVRVRGNKGPLCHIEDVSGDFSNIGGTPDGYDDLVCQFEDDSSTWVPVSAEAELTGSLLPEFGQILIIGSDSICIKPD